MSQLPVLVVGAGPVGLASAAFLAKFGIPVRIIDSNSSPTTLSKALVLWRRSIHTLAPIIPREQWHGFPVGGICLADEGAVFAQVDVGGKANSTKAIITDNDSTSASTALGAANQQQEQQLQHAAPQQHMLPTGLMITQASVEAQMTQYLQKQHNITVQRHTALTSFKFDESSGCVHCTLTTTSPAPQDATHTHSSQSKPGTQGPEHHSQEDNKQQQEQQQQQHEAEEVVASYLIGCDGGRSAVRKALGIAFPGVTFPDRRWVLADCSYEVEAGINSHQPQQPEEGEPQHNRLLVTTSAAGTIGIIPIAGRPGTLRIVWNADKGGPAQPTLEDFQSLLMAHTRLQVRLKEVLWVSEFCVNERQVESYVHCNGHVLLAGDAAHVHTPAGGQGMNTGLQDAANLAWKVALVAAGEAAAGQQLLQTYQEERHPVGASVVSNSGLLLRANSMRHPVLRFVRRMILGSVIQLPMVRNTFISSLAEDTVSYAGSSLATGASTGDSSSAAAKCAGTAFPDVSIKVDGVMRPATVLLQGSSSSRSFGTLVLLGPGTGTSSSSGSGHNGQQKQQGAAARGSDDDDEADWPSHWGHWELSVVHVAAQSRAEAANMLKLAADADVLGDDSAGAGGLAPAAATTASAATAAGSVGAGAEDAFGLLSGALGGCAGVLVRPDGMIAAAGGPEQINRWLNKIVRVAN